MVLLRVATGKHTAPWLLGILSFLLCTLAQPDWSRAACLIAASCGLALFWKATQSLSKKQRFLISTGWFAGIELIQLSWFLSDRYVGAFIYPVVVLICLALGLQFGLISVWIRSFKELSILPILAIASGWVLLEWSRLLLLSGFSWNPLGLMLSANPFSLQIASLAGVFGMSFWVIFTNLLALHFLEDFSSKLKGVNWLVASTLPYLCGGMLYGAHQAEMKQDKTPPLRALLVQTALRPEAKISLNNSTPFTPYTQWEKILSLLAPYQGEAIDLITFSEGVVPYGTTVPVYHPADIERLFKMIYKQDFHFSRGSTEGVGNAFWAQQLANYFFSDVVIGLEDVEHRGDKKNFYNAAFLFRPFSETYDRYEKRVLVPIGEYMPFEWCYKILSSYGVGGGYVPGQEAKVFQAAKAPLSISICYEETYGHMMREGRKQGAKAFVNLSNDVWYPYSRLPMVHFMQGRIRAVENGIPLLRCCNTGVTCGVDALGRQVACLAYEKKGSEAQEGVLNVSLPLYHYSTLYVHYGDIPLVVSSFLWVFLSFAQGFFAYKKLGAKKIQIFRQ